MTIMLVMTVIPLADARAHFSAMLTRCATRTSAGRFAARRGPYRVIYEIDEGQRVVRLLHADHRADAYRRRV